MYHFEFLAFRTLGIFLKRVQVGIVPSTLRQAQGDCNNEVKIWLIGIAYPSPPAIGQGQAQGDCKDR